MTCAAFGELVPELALGLLDGRERAAALAHAARCDACQHELTALGEVADDLVTLTPAIEPPPGFETRVLAALRAGQPRRSPFGQPARRVRVLAAAAAVAAGVALGGWALAGGFSESPTQYAAGAVSAPLMVGGHQMGEVTFTRSAWLTMAVEGGPPSATVTCQVLHRNGDVVTVGSFQLADGQGYWAAAVPGGSADVVAARLVAANGKTIATADLRA